MLITDIHTVTVGRTANGARVVLRESADGSGYVVAILDRTGRDYERYKLAEWMAMYADRPAELSAVRAALEAMYRLGDGDGDD